MRKIKKRLFVLVNSFFSLTPENRTLTELIYTLIDAIDNGTATVKIDAFKIAIQTPNIEVYLSNLHRFTDWLSAGIVNDEKYSNIRPSHAAIYDFKECLKKHGYYIYLNWEDVVELKIKDEINSSPFSTSTTELVKTK